MSTTLLQSKLQNTSYVSFEGNQLQATTRYKLTAEDVYALIEKGRLSESDWLELINGDLYAMPLPGPKHIFHVNRIANILTSMFFPAKKAMVSTQNPLKLDVNNLVVPDIALLKFQEDSDEDHEVSINDVLLVIEVSHTTIHHDRERKIPIYAKAGIPEVWIMNVPQKVVHVYREVAEGRYEQQFDIVKSKELAPLAFAEDKLIVFA